MINFQTILDTKEYIPLYEDKPTDKINTIYFWYDDPYIGISPETVKAISNSIENHDWDTFCKYFYAPGEHEFYLPDTMSVYSGDEIIGLLKITPETFGLIEYSECG